MHAILECLNKFLSYAKGAPIPILMALTERRGSCFQKFSTLKILAAILECLNKFLSYAKGAQILILKVLSERRGSCFQKFSALKILARDFRMSK